jgi:polysaccharide biosynthesis protein PslH
VRILFLCHRVPYPPDKGDKIRAFHQLKALSAKHDIDLFTLADDPQDLNHQAALSEWCQEVTIVPIHPRWQRIKSLPYLFTHQPLTNPYFYSEELQTQIDAALSRKSYDRIYVYCSAMAQYVENVTDVPIVVDLVDVDSDKWVQYASFSPFPLSLIYRREGKLLREYELSICKRVAAVIVCTEREAKLLGSVGESRVFAIPNGVDAEYFHQQGPPEDAHTIIFTGDMAYFPNQQAVEYFAREVLPLIRRDVPSAKFLIVGRNPNASVLSLREIEGVEVTGSIPDVRPYLKRASVAVAPFVIAAGIQNKILEAMACERPVVATAKVTQGLTPTAARLVTTGRDSQELATAVVKLLKNMDLSQSIGLEGRRCVLEEYSWRNALERFVELVVDPLHTVAKSA